jgi:hypothetical protein
MKVEKEQFDTLLRKMLQQTPEKTSAIKGKQETPAPIIPPKTAPKSSGQQ